MLFVSFILVESREDQRCAAPVLWGLISPPQKIHTCVFWDYTSAFGHLAVFKIIASFWRELQPCPLNRVRQGWKEWHLCSSHLWIIDTSHPLDSPGTRVENVSLHNGLIAQTCCLGCSGGERRQGAKQKCVNSVPPSLIQHSCASADFYCIWPHLFFH